MYILVISSRVRRNMIDVSPFGKSSIATIASPLVLVWMKYIPILIEHHLTGASKKIWISRYVEWCDAGSEKLLGMNSCNSGISERSYIFPCSEFLFWYMIVFQASWDASIAMLCVFLSNLCQGIWRACYCHLDNLYLR